MNWKSDEYLGYRPTILDWARLAAYIDGEGSINLTPRLSRQNGSMTFCAKVIVTNTDFRLPKWCVDIFGMRAYGSSNNNKQNPNWKGCVYAQACGYKAAWILLNCLPHFIIKREQASVVLEHQETIGPDIWQRGSGIKTPENILSIRMALKSQLRELNKRGPKRPDAQITNKVMEA